MISNVNVDNTGEKDCHFEVEIVSHEARIFKKKNVPTKGPERKPLDNVGAKVCGVKHKIGEAEVAEAKYMKMTNGISKPMKSSKPEVNDLSISVQEPELTPSSSLVSSLIIAPILVAGSSEFQLSKGEELHEIQNPTVEKNDQNQSAPMKWQAPVVSNVIATDLGITQVSVCLKCGDEGFLETLVYCNNCQIYALHRYCLDGPVVFTRDVTWFCEDCEESSSCDSNY